MKASDLSNRSIFVPITIQPETPCCLNHNQSWPHPWNLTILVPTSKHLSPHSHFPVSIRNQDPALMEPPGMEKYLIPSPDLLNYFSLTSDFFTPLCDSFIKLKYNFSFKELILKMVHLGSILEGGCQWVIRFCWSLQLLEMEVWGLRAQMAGDGHFTLGKYTLCLNAPTFFFFNLPLAMI